MKRRSFLKMIGFGVGAAAAPTLVHSKDDTTKIVADLVNTPVELGLSPRGNGMESRGTVPFKYLVVHIDGLTWSVPVHNRRVDEMKYSLPIKMLYRAEAIYDPFNRQFIKHRRESSDYSFMVDDIFPKIPNDIHNRYTFNTMKS